MKTRLIEIGIVVILLALVSICFAAWHNELPADSDALYGWPASIRANWDALEVAFGVDLVDAPVNIETIINVTNSVYGADPTGVADSTPAIQAAIDAAIAAGRGLVYIPTGTYNIATPIVYNASYICLQGDGPSLSILSGTNGQDSVINATGLFNSIKGISIVGNNVTHGIRGSFRYTKLSDIFIDDAITGLEINGCSEIELNKVFIQGGTTCLTLGLGAGIYADCSNITLIDCDLSGGTTMLEITDARVIRMIGGSIDGLVNGGVGVDIIGDTLESYGYYFYGVHFEGTADLATTSCIRTTRGANPLHVFAIENCDFGIACTILKFDYGNNLTFKNNLSAGGGTLIDISTRNIVTDPLNAVYVNNDGEIILGATISDGFFALSPGTAGDLYVEGAEATADIEADASTTIHVNVPSGAKILGVQLRVDVALTAGELWDAAYAGGVTQNIVAGEAVAQNTKVNLFFNENANTAIAAAEVDIAITKNGGGNFTAVGTIRAIVYYQAFTAMADL